MSKTYAGQKKPHIDYPLSMQCQDLERDYLASLVQNRRNIEATMHLLKPEDFDLKEHRLMFTAILDLFVNRIGGAAPGPVDGAMIDSWLKQRGAKLNYLDNEILYAPVLAASTMDPVEDSLPMAEEIAKASRMRRLYARLFGLLEQVKTDPHDEDAACAALMDACGDTVSAMTSTNQGATAKIAVELDQIADAAIKDMKDRVEAKKRGMATCLTFNIKTMDMVIGGLFPGDLSVVGARPSLGKTAFTLYLFERAHMQKIPAAFFELEIGANQVYHRLLSKHSAVPFTKLSRGDNYTADEWTRIERAREAMASTGRLVLCQPNMSADEIHAHVRIIKSRHPDLGVVFIDGLWLMRHTKERGDNDASAIADTVIKLRNMALGMNIHVCLVHQLNREAEGRATAKESAQGKSAPPKISDLKGSGAIEENAALIMLLDRPMYGQEHGGAQAKPQEDMTIIVGKNRRGTTHRGLTIVFDMECQTFYDKDMMSYGTHPRSGR